MKMAVEFSDEQKILKSKIETLMYSPDFYWFISPKKVQDGKYTVESSK